ncbi:MAG: S-adenosylmethionine:tRNA ribosyltransferase-isomerase, partial [Acidimicrobiales bacterium]
VLAAAGADLVEVGERLGDGRRRVRLLAPAEQVLAAGSIPLPPYIHEPLADTERYQTVYAACPGSVAAPTAGLHLTHQVLDRCRDRGATVVDLDLAIGLGTFQPVIATRAEDHVMHVERYRVSPATMDACRQARRVIAVGTTTVRALESAAATGELTGRSDLFIRGDYPFLLVDVLLTNFHQPRSTLLLLLEAFCGPGWRDLYRTALDSGYRFLSFGDAMLVGRSGPG